MKVALAYGYAEGPRIAKEFLSVAHQFGHELVSIADADVIIAHSGGSYMIPDKNDAKAVMLVDVPYYDSHKSFVKKLYRRVAEEGWSLKSIRKFSWNSWYVISSPKRYLQMYRAIIDGNLHGLEGKKVLFVRNSQDLFGVIDQDRQAAVRLNAKIEELPGHHDDIWAHPEAYLKLAEKHI